MNGNSVKIPPHVKLCSLVKINDPDKEGDYLLIEEGAFNADIHSLFGEEKKKRVRKTSEEV